MGQSRDNQVADSSGSSQTPQTRIQGAQGGQRVQGARGAIAKGAIGPRGAKAPLEGRREKAWGTIQR